jgi:hypothetical protein
MTIRKRSGLFAGGVTESILEIAASAFVAAAFRPAAFLIYE